MGPPLGKKRGIRLRAAASESGSVGKTLSALNMLIGAHAIAAGATLVTSDKVFLQLADLTVANWAADRP
jgi:predicted nucleic acid-binding protein